MSSGGQSRINPGSSTSESGSISSDASGSILIEIRAREAGRILIEIEQSLLERLQRLQAVEARLSKAAAARRQRPGRRAVRQIERERQRLARDLHTGVGQLLAAIRIQLEIIGALLPNPPDAVREALGRIGSLAVSALEEVRGISRQFYAPEWQRLSLDQALRQLLDASGVPQRFETSVDAPPLPFDPDPDVKMIIYRAAQEAISNIMRHAQATRVDVRLTVVAGRLQLSVHDNGVGFDAAQVLRGPASATAGIGLRSLREQAADLGGKVLVRSGSEGTTLEVFVPISIEEKTQEQ